MIFQLREMERVESRVLGALRCIDAGTRTQVEGSLAVQVPGARVRRNRSGLYVIVSADALAAHEDAFHSPPAEPAIGSVALEAIVQDPAGLYLPRRAALALPRDPDPAHATQPGSLFRAIELPLYPSASAPTGLNWAVLRISVHDQASGDALGGALLIARNNGQVLGRALTDWRGEALLPVAGVPVTTWSDDPDAVVVSELAAQLEWVFDPARGMRTPAAQVRAGRPPAVLPLVDPDALEAERADLPRATQAVALAAGRSQTLSLPLALP
jgi:hypothetical protein